MSEEKPSLIILNGVSSAGKTTTTKTLQESFTEPYLHMGVDSFWAMLPKGALAKNFPAMPKALVGCAEAHLKAGHNLIIDIVCGPQLISALSVTLENYRPYLVALKPNLTTLQAREIARGDRKIGLAESQMINTYNGITYDLVIDNSTLSALETAKIIMAGIKTRTQKNLNKPSPSI